MGRGDVVGARLPASADRAAQAAMAKRRRSSRGLALAGLVVLLALRMLAPLAAGTAAQRIDPAVRDRIVPAAVQVAIDVTWVEGSYRTPAPIPLGSGTVVSPDGLILTNAHVVERSGIARTVRDFEAVAREYSPEVTLEFSRDHFLILVSDGVHPPEPAYRATTAAYDGELDLAVLKVAATADGGAIGTALSLPFVPMGDASGLRLGDQVHVFGYPASGGDALTYTQGVVSGFNFEDGIDGPAWINTDATMSGGNSGGAAVNDAGELIGVPTQGTQLDCRPGDTNRDGKVTAEDVGCIPLGGSIGQLRPIGLAMAVLSEAGWRPGPATVRGEPRDGGGEPAGSTKAIDLPAVALGPADLRDSGMGEFSLLMGDLADSVEEIDDSLGSPVRSPGIAWLRSAGALQVHWRALTPAGEPVHNGQVDLILGIQLVSFVDAASAREFVAIQGSGPEWSAAPVTSGLGPDARLGSASSASGTEIWALLPEDNIAVAVFAYGEQRQPPPREVLTDLARRQIDRIRAMTPTGSDSLAELPVRLAGETVEDGGEFYLYRDGVFEDWYLLEPEDRAWLEIRIRKAGVTGLYRHSRSIQTSEAPGAQVHTDVQVLAFRSEEAASRWLSDWVGSRAWPGLQQVHEDPNAPTLGDESLVCWFEDPRNEAPWLKRGGIAVVRVGDRVAEVTVRATAPINEKGLHRLAQAQAERLLDPEPPLRQPLPAGFLDPSAAPTATSRPTVAHGPTATAQPKPTATPTPRPFGFVAELDGSDVVVDRADAYVAFENGRLRISILQPGAARVQAWRGAAWSDRGLIWKAEVASTSGQGQILLELSSEQDDADWDFAVDPVSQTWALHRQSIASGDLFTSVEPRSYRQFVSEPIETLEVRVVNGKPSLLINGSDVVTPLGIEMPSISGNLDVGLGAGMDPDSPSGHSTPFTVEFERATLSPIP